MALPPITYGSLTQYFHNVALGQTTGAVSASQIANALTSLLGRGSTTSASSSAKSTSFNYGTAPVQSSISSSLVAAKQAVTNASASAKRLDDVDTQLDKVSKLAGSLAPSNNGIYGDATSLPAVGGTALPDTLQGNINRAQRAAGLSGAQQTQEETAAQTRFSALRTEAQSLVNSLQRVQLSDPTRQRAFDNAVSSLQSALADNNSDPNRVRSLSFSAATNGGLTSAGTFDASTQGSALAPIGRTSARAAVDQLSSAITAARNALAPDLTSAKQKVTAAQGVVSQLTQFQTQANNNSLSFGVNTNSYLYNPVSLLQFQRGGLVNLFA